MKSLQLWHISQDLSVLKPVNLPGTDNDAIAIEASYSLISIGSERLVVQGKVPTEIQEDMRIPMMEGSYLFPLTYGYSLVGKVIEGLKPWYGKRVHILHPHQSHVQCRPDQVREIPDGVPSMRAALASNLETALNAVWDSRILPGERVLIVGGGLIGLLVRSILTEMVLDSCIISDIETSKVLLAREFGWNAEKPDLMDGSSFDLAFHCSGTSAGLQTAVNLVRTEGRVIELSWFGNEPVELLLGGSFHSGRKKIISSQVSSIPGHMRHAWDHARRKEMVFKLLENSIYDRLITRTIPFQETPAFYDELRKGGGKELGVLIEY